ncbi:hypothetical protein [Flavobacterium agrisoli]|uniref:Uncharacterized protein n=1 Tax=Flavobacterium agrisoli TaxID=2793066 RepID=A0A934UKJ2_9FLAO|nr:hypothetical protein [Flavobacterium agrisoli]MBK0370500.1 hypothetical protein [Flavobacterium agrisoli]
MLAITLLIFFIQYIVQPDLIDKFNLFEILITNSLLIVYMLMHSYNMLESKREFYFVNLGLLIYLLSSTILFIFGNLTANLSKDVKMITWTLNAALTVMYQLFFLYEWKVSYVKKTLKN